MRTRVATSLCAVVIAVVGLVGFVGPAAAHGSPMAPNGGDESSFVAKINALRASKGVRPLQVSGTLTALARGWSSHMAAAGGISHNPNLAADVPGAWQSVGENVGVGYDVDSLWKAFVASPAHYANLVDPDYNYVGVGDVWAADGRLFTTHDFEQLEGGGSSPPTTPPPAANPGGSSHGSSSATHSGSSSSARPTPPAPPPPPPPPPRAAPARVSTVLIALHALQP